MFLVPNYKHYFAFLRKKWDFLDFQRNSEDENCTLLPLRLSDGNDGSK